VTATPALRAVVKLGVSDLYIDRDSNGIPASKAKSLAFRISLRSKYTFSPVTARYIAEGIAAYLHQIQNLARKMNRPPK
jgi:hypothetical protein